MSTINTLYVDNDNLLEVRNLRDELTGNYITDADVAVTLFDEGGTEVSGDTFPKPLDYVADSKGVYRVVLPYTLDLVVDGRYTAEVVVDAGSGRQGMWPLEMVARART